VTIARTSIYATQYSSHRARDHSTVQPDQVNKQEMFRLAKSDKLQQNTATAIVSVLVLLPRGNRVKKINVSTESFMPYQFGKIFIKGTTSCDIASYISRLHHTVEIHYALQLCCTP
jgi:hypothetical protein